MKSKNGRGKKQIFIIDDDNAIREILTIMLNGEQFEADAFATGRSALDGTDIKRPDLILLDYYLPGEDAEEVIGEFRERISPDLPILLMSAHTSASEVVDRLELNDFLSKPFQRETVFQAIRKCLYQ